MLCVLCLFDVKELLIESAKVGCRAFRELLRCDIFVRLAVFDEQCSRITIQVDTDLCCFDLWSLLSGVLFATRTTFIISLKLVLVHLECFLK